MVVAETTMIVGVIRMVKRSKSHVTTACHGSAPFLSNYQRRADNCTVAMGDLVLAGDANLSRPSFSLHPYDRDVELITISLPRQLCSPDGA